MNKTTPIYTSKLTHNTDHDAKMAVMMPTIQHQYTDYTKKNRNSRRTNNEKIKKKKTMADNLCIERCQGPVMNYPIY